MAKKGPVNKNPVKKAPANKKWVKKKVKKQRKLGGWWLLANVLSFGLVIGTAIVIFFGDKPGANKAVDNSSGTDTTEVKKERVETKKEVILYFGSPDGESLLGRSRSVKKSKLSEEVAGAVELLLIGPINTGVRRRDRAERTLPAGTRLLGVSITGNTAIINLSKELVEAHDGGTAAEMQTIYSLVNTIGLGWAQIRDVQLLVEGRRVETIAGHIETKLPLRPDRTVNIN